MRASRRPRLWPRPPQRLSTQVVIMMAAILVLTMAAGFLVVQWNMRRQFTEQYEHQSQSVAQTLAANPDVAWLVTNAPPRGALPQIPTPGREQTAALVLAIPN